MKKESIAKSNPHPLMGMHGREQRNFLLAVLLPFFFLGLQWVCWPYISPFVWFLFFPTVFISAKLGRLKGGLISTALSTLIVVYFFIPPQLSWEIKNPYNLFSVGMFLIMGCLFSDVQERAWAANRRTKELLKVTQGTNETITNNLRVGAEALREGDKRYRELFEQAILGIFQSTMDGKVLSVNPAFAQMFGYESPGEVLAAVKNISTDIFADPRRREEIIRLRAENPELNTFENLYRRKVLSANQNMSWFLFR